METQAPLTLCPFCREKIQPDACVCPHCTREIPGGGGALNPAAKNHFSMALIWGFIAIILFFVFAVSGGCN